MHKDEENGTDFEKDYTPGEKPVPQYPKKSKDHNWFGEDIKMLIGVGLGMVITVVAGIIVAVTCNDDGNDPKSQS